MQLNVLDKNAARRFKRNHRLTLPVSYGYRAIGQEAFKGFTLLKSIRIPEGVAVIEREAFKNCTALREVALPSSLKAIGEGAFENCPCLEKVRLPARVRALPERCFKNDKRLTAVTTQGSLDAVAKDAFCNCVALEELPDLAGLGSIGDRAFYRCKGLCGTLVLPDSLHSIGDEAFLGTGISGLDLGKGVTTMGFKCFFRCRQLTEVEIPGNVRRIDEWAFHGCSSLKSMVMLYDPEIGDWLTNRCTTWYCPEGSPVVDYCRRHEYPVAFREPEAHDQNQTCYG